jgi:hypothetical protein
MADSYLELAEQQLKAAAKLLNTPQLTPDERQRYEDRIRLAEQYTKLAAIQAGLPPEECKPPVTPDDGEPPGRRP